MVDGKLLELVIAVAPALATKLLAFKKGDGYNSEDLQTVILAANYELLSQNLNLLEKHCEDVNHALNEFSDKAAVLLERSGKVLERSGKVGRR